MPYSFTLTTVIPASPREIYDAWLDSVAHAEMTGGEANMSDEVGAEVSAWDGYITGRNVELVSGERIVQTWRTTEFDDEDEDSIVTITLENVEDGALLTLEHANVPDEQRSYEESGWQSNYFEPMTVYFAARVGAAEETPAEAAAEAPVPQSAPPRRTAPEPKKARAAKKPARGAAKGATKRAAKNAGKSAAKGAAKSAPKRAAKRTAKKPPKRAAKSARKSKRSVGSASKRKAARPKTSRAAAAKRPRAKKAARKGAQRGKRK
jgi:uncharacterized protein YndB with AHSA1/START domain